jgi:hypothetical protein
MDEGGDTAAQKEALGIIRQGLRQRSIRRRAPAGGAGVPDGNVGEVMEREPEIEAALGEEEIEEEAPAPEPERRTILERFTPRSMSMTPAPAPQTPVKRGPGRPRKER